MQYVWQSVLFPSFTGRFQTIVLLADLVTSQPNIMFSLLFLSMNIEVYLDIMVWGEHSMLRKLDTTYYKPYFS